MMRAWLVMALSLKGLPCLSTLLTAARRTAQQLRGAQCRLDGAVKVLTAWPAMTVSLKG